jgi:hypothetical protein
MKLSILDGWALIGAVTLTLVISHDATAAQRAVPRGNSGGGDQATSPAPQGGGSPAPQGARAPSSPRGNSGGSTRSASPAETKSGSGSAGSSAAASNGDSDGPAVPYGRPRESRPTGTATVRTSPPPRGGSDGFPTYYYPLGYYPWGYGGYGFGGYYGGGYYGGYDPWGYGYGYPRNYSIRYADDGALRLKIKPNQASVFVDGYFAGQVDEFDGIFQRLHVEPGPHRIEIRADGYQPLFFDVRILPDRTVTYSGELKRF